MQMTQICLPVKPKLPKSFKRFNKYAHITLFMVERRKQTKPRYFLGLKINLLPSTSQSCPLTPLDGGYLTASRFNNSENVETFLHMRVEDES